MRAKRICANTFPDTDKREIDTIMIYISDIIYNHWYFRANPAKRSLICII